MRTSGRRNCDPASLPSKRSHSELQGQQAGYKNNSRKVQKMDPEPWAVEGTAHRNQAMTRDEKVNILKILDGLKNEPLPEVVELFKAHTPAKELRRNVNKGVLLFEAEKMSDDLGRELLELLNRISRRKDKTLNRRKKATRLQLSQEEKPNKQQNVNLSQKQNGVKNEDITLSQKQNALRYQDRKLSQETKAAYQLQRQGSNYKEKLELKQLRGP